MKLSAICCTYLRPHLLGELIESFLRQTYPVNLRELIILDDAGQYHNQRGDGWRLVSIPRRFRTIGEKRNACAALASRDTDGFLVADDDDIYLPHWFETHAKALEQAEWSHPSIVLVEDGNGGYREEPTHSLYHACWGFRRDTFYRYGGYAALNVHHSQPSLTEDQNLLLRLKHGQLSECDPCQFAEPFFLRRMNVGGYHLSHIHEDGVFDLKPRGEKCSFSVGWKQDYDRLAVTKLPPRSTDCITFEPQKPESELPAASKTVLLSAYFTNQLDHQRMEQFPSDDPELLLMAKTAERLGVNSIIFYDALSPEFIQKHTSLFTAFVKVPPPHDISNNDYRMFVYREWLKSREYKSVWCSDLFDVRVNLHPDIMLDGYHDLWIGIHRDYKICDGTPDGDWIDREFRKFFIQTPEVVLQKPILMAGTWGGYTGPVRHLLDLITQEYLRYFPGDRNYDMALFNLVAYRDLPPLKVWAKGAPLHSEFRAYDNEAQVCFVHK